MVIISHDCWRFWDCGLKYFLFIKLPSGDRGHGCEALYIELICDSGQFNFMFGGH